MHYYSREIPQNYEINFHCLFFPWTWVLWPMTPSEISTNNSPVSPIFLTRAPEYQPFAVLPEMLYFAHCWDRWHPAPGHEITEILWKKHAQPKETGQFILDSRVRWWDGFQNQYLFLWNLWESIIGGSLCWKFQFGSKIPKHALRCFEGILGEILKPTTWDDLSLARYNLPQIYRVVLVPSSDHKNHHNHHLQSWRAYRETGQPKFIQITIISPT